VKLTTLCTKTGQKFF